MPIKEMTTPRPIMMPMVEAKSGVVTRLLTSPLKSVPAAMPARATPIGSP